MNFKKYWPIIAFLLIFIFILVSFLWKEDLSLSKSINSDKFGNFGGLLGSLLTGITVLLLYRQINEMIVDRKSASQPDLYPTETIFETSDEMTSITLSQNSNYPIPLFFRIENGTKSKDFSTHVKLYNIGLGAAKEIKIRWEYDEQEIIQIIQGIYATHKYDEAEHLIDFAPPSNIVEITLPFHYMKACGSLCNDKIGELILNEAYKKFKPSLKLCMQFKDIFNNLHKREFDVKFECFENNISVKFHQLK